MTRVKRELLLLTMSPIIIVILLAFLVRYLELEGWLENASVMWIVFFEIAIFTKFNPKSFLFKSLLMGLNSTAVIFTFSFYGVAPLIGTWWPVVFLAVWILIAFICYWLMLLEEKRKISGNERMREQLEFWEQALALFVVLVSFLGLVVTIGRAVNAP